MESFPTRGSIIAAENLPPQVSRNELQIPPSFRPGQRRANVPPGPSAPTTGLFNPTVGGSNHPQKRIRIDGLGDRPSQFVAASAADYNLSDSLDFSALRSNTNMLPLRRSARNTSFGVNGGVTRNVIGGAEGVSAPYE